MEGNDEVVANFIAITGSSEGQALQMLEATGYELQQAIELFFAAGGETDQGHANLGGGAASASDPPVIDDEAFARQLHEQARSPIGTEEAQVRAPLPTVRERLYGEEFFPPSAAAARRRMENPVPTNVVDAFRDFKSEAASAEAAGGSGGGSGLATMFEPPRQLLFTGSFDEAKGAASQAGRWLLLNLQSSSQFASHQLNRDTWRNPMVLELVENNFILYQVYDVVEEAAKLASFYGVYELPAIIVVDPVTGAPMKQWTGFVQPERFLEDLLPFLDTTFSDPGAARLAASLKRKKTQFAAAGGPAGGTSGSGMDLAGHKDNTNGSGGFEYDEEKDPELMAALQASMEVANHHQQQQQSREEDILNVEEEEEEEEESEKTPTRSAAEVAREAEERLPEEPEGPEGCRIALRFPDGSRGQRRFPRCAPLSSIHDWCLVQQPEAAGGRSFFLSEGFPGAPALHGASDKTLEELGVADAMLVMKWTADS